MQLWWLRQGRVEKFEQPLRGGWPIKPVQGRPDSGGAAPTLAEGRIIPSRFNSAALAARLALGSSPTQQLQGLLALDVDQFAQLFKSQFQVFSTDLNLNFGTVH